MRKKQPHSRVAGLLVWGVCYLICLSGCGGPFNSGFGSGAAAELIAKADEIVEEGLRDEDPRIRASAIEVVAETRRMGFMPAVQRLLTDDFVPVRFAAVMVVADTAYVLAEPSVRTLLRDPDENIRIAAAYCLSRLGDGSYLRLIRRAVKSKDQTVRANAVMLLGKNGDKGYLRLVYWAMRDTDSADKVRFQAAEAAARLGDEKIYAKLWAMLISAYADDRVMGIRAMGALGTVKARNALITLLDDAVLEVRLAAAEQIGALGDNSGEPEVLDVFTGKHTRKMNQAELERVNVLTALAIGQIRTAKLTRFLPQLLGNKSKLVRLATAKAVFQCQKIQ